MKQSKQKNMAMIVVSAAILIAVNLGVWLAAEKGAIAPIANHSLWMAFVALNVVSLVWSISLLGLQPLVVAISYVAGGILAFKGVQGMSDISVAEITTAGATYGAFGALAVGNSTAKVRLAFFNKGQIPFVFIIAALLVFDAVLNSGISSANGSVILNAVVFPFVLAGVIIGLVWSVLNRYGIGQKVELVQDEIAAQHPDIVTQAEEIEEENTLKIRIPATVEEEEESDAVAAAMEDVEIPETTEAPAKEAVKPIVAKEETNGSEEEFFPLEIDKDDEFILPKEDAYGEIELAADLDEDLYSLSAFDANLYASGADDEGHGGVMVEKPIVAVSLDIDEQEALAEEPAKAPAAEVAPAKPEPAKSPKSEDWLSGHLDLLSKLK